MTRSHAETMARHAGPFVLVAWKRPPDPKSNRGLPLKYISKPDGDPVAAAMALIANGAESVGIWSTSEQQFVTTARAGDPGDAAPRPAAEIGPAGTAKRAGRGGEYAAVPGVVPPNNLGSALSETLAEFEARGAATVAEVAAATGLSTDVVASRATRLKGLGLLSREEK